MNNLSKHIYLNLCRRPFALLLERGKTAGETVARDFAALAGATEENGRFLALEVLPDWMDSSDLFGHRKLDGTFVPGAILDFLKQVWEDPKNTYVLCFSRLILSRAEYWLRELLDGVTARENGRRYELVNDLYYGSDASAKAKYGTICMPENLYILATVDLNEASLPLNQRLLDRTCAIRLEKDDRVEGEIPAMETRPVTLEGEAVQRCFREFAGINRVLIPANAYVGYQIRNEAAAYMEQNRQQQLLEESVAMDLQIRQRILPRIQGSSRNVAAVLAQVEHYCREEYPLSAAEAARMLSACEKDGYASYWE